MFFRDPANAHGLAIEASNLKGGENPPFTKDDFYGFAPQFQDLLTDFMLEQFIAMADAVVQEARWHEQWKLGMCWFTAHMATLYLEAMPGDNPTASQVVEAAKLRGLQTSASVGDVSVSYDYSNLMSNSGEWLTYQSTSYGRQFAAYAKLLGKAGMYVR